MSKRLNALLCLRAPEIGSEDFSLRLGALEPVIQFVEKLSDVSVSAMALDEPGGDELLRTCLAHVADTAFLVRGPAITAADAAAAGYLIADAVGKIQRGRTSFDLIFCIDSDLGQDGLGPALASCLDRPQVIDATSVQPDGRHFLIQQRRDGEIAQIRVTPPCVISFRGASVLGRYPELPRLMAANCAQLQVVQTTIDPPAWKSVVLSERPRPKQIMAFQEPGSIPKLVSLLKQDFIL